MWLIWSFMDSPSTSVLLVTCVQYVYLTVFIFVCKPLWQSTVHVDKMYIGWFDFYSPCLCCLSVSCSSDLVMIRWLSGRALCLSSFSSPTSSLAYISSINPVLGGLLWSLCALWAMVIICLLCSHCFMCLVCSHPPASHPPSLPLPLFCSLLFTLHLSHSYWLLPLLCYATSMSTLSASLAFITRQYLYFHHSCLFWLFSFSICCLLLCLSCPVDSCATV